MLILKKAGVCLLWMVCLWMLSVSENTSELYANDIDFKPQVGTSFGYDDNIYFSGEDEISDTYLQVVPELELERRTEVSQLRAGIKYGLIRHQDEDALDRDSQNYKLTGRYTGNERLFLGASLEYRKDTTLDTYLEDIGRVVQQDDSNHYRAQGNLVYQLTEKTSLSVDYGFRKTDYDSQLFFTNESHEFHLSYFKKLKNEIDQLYIKPGYYHRTTDFEEVDDFSLSIGWRRALGEVIDMNALIGAGYATVEQNDGFEYENWGARAQFDLDYRSELSRVRVSYLHDLRTTVDGDEVTVDNLHLHYTRSVSERFSCGVNARGVYSTELSGEQELNDVFYYNIEPYISYRITEYSTIEMVYQYQNQYDDALEDNRNLERNRVWIQINMGWPLVL